MGSRLRGFEQKRSLVRNLRGNIVTKCSEKHAQVEKKRRRGTTSNKCCSLPSPDYLLRALCCWTQAFIMNLILKFEEGRMKMHRKKKQPTLFKIQHKSKEEEKDGVNFE